MLWQLVRRNVNHTDIFQSHLHRNTHVSSSRFRDSWILHKAIQIQKVTGKSYKPTKIFEHNCSYYCRFSLTILNNPTPTSLTTIVSRVNHFFFTFEIPTLMQKMSDFFRSQERFCLNFSIYLVNAWKLTRRRQVSRKLSSRLILYLSGKCYVVAQLFKR